jgi:glycosyltransferase involved in cell wall biosynthesis
MLFNHGEEAALAAEIFSSVPVAKKGAVVGMGFDIPEESTTAEPTDGAVSELLASGKRYLIYSGRKEAGKNLPLLIDAFESLRRDLGDDSLELVLIGAGDISFRDSLPDGVLDLGFVSESEKRILFRNALALVQPSVNESFSIVMMEAWLERTPVIVHSQGRVTRAHVVGSGGGLYFADEAELAAVIKHLLETPGLRELLGNAGYEYVSREYSWSSVLTRFRDGINRIWRNETDVTLPLPASSV